MRFVIITLPPAEIARKIDQIRRPWNLKPGNQEVLRYPPHVTLRTGLVCPDDQVDKVAEAFLRHAARCHTAPARTQGLFSACYPSEKGEQILVGWSVVLQDSLRALHHNLLLFRDWPKGPQGPFRPHVSLVYGDQAVLGDPAPQVPDFEWTIDHVALYHETPEGWIEWGRAPLL